MILIKEAFSKYNVDYFPFTVKYLFKTETQDFYHGNQFALLLYFLSITGDYE